jgi:hypothetical protein
VRVTETIKESSVSVFEAGGNRQEKLEKKGRSVVYVEEVLTAGLPGERPRKAKRTYERFDLTRDDKVEKSPLAGKTVLIENRGARYAFRHEGGGPVEPEAAVELDREFNKGGSLVRNPDLLPARPVKPGDTWSPDKAKLLSELTRDGTALDVDKTAVTAKLVKAYTKGAKQFGVIELKLEAPIRSLPGKTPVAVKEGSVMTLTLTVDACVDGSDPTVSVTGRGVYRIEATANGVDVNVTAEADQTATREPLPKK